MSILGKLHYSFNKRSQNLSYTKMVTDFAQDVSLNFACLEIIMLIQQQQCKLSFSLTDIRFCHSITFITTIILHNVSAWTILYFCLYVYLQSRNSYACFFKLTIHCCYGCVLFMSSTSPCSKHVCRELQENSGKTPVPAAVIR